MIMRGVRWVWRCHPHEPNYDEENVKLNLERLNAVLGVMARDAERWDREVEKRAQQRHLDRQEGT